GVGDDNLGLGACERYGPGAGPRDRRPRDAPAGPRTHRALRGDGALRRRPLRGHRRPGRGLGLRGRRGDPRQGRRGRGVGEGRRRHRARRRPRRRPLRRPRRRPPARGARRGRHRRRRRRGRGRGARRGRQRPRGGPGRRRRGPGRLRRGDGRHRLRRRRGRLRRLLLRRGRRPDQGDGHTADAGRDHLHVRRLRAHRRDVGHHLRVAGGGRGPVPPRRRPRRGIRQGGARHGSRPDRRRAAALGRPQGRRASDARHRGGL
ncbi:MAG: Alkaline phosphatase, partial [uncultured Rubrobacteraceae bacterium]